MSHAYALRRLSPSPRDLDWLLASLLCVLLLHVAHLSAWVSVMMVGILAWRYQAANRGWAMPGFWMLLPITILSAVGIMVTYRGLFGRDASVALLTVMLSLKLLESRTSRDFTLVAFFGYFLAANTFLFNQSIFTAGFVLIPIFGLTMTLAGINRPNSSGDWRFHGRLAGSLLLQAVPLMLVFFVLFPRLPGPLWGVPKDSYRNMTGLSDSMSPGNISELTLSGATAFRVTFAQKAPPQNALYWRGPIFSYYDGISWRASGLEQSLPHESLAVSDNPISYTVTLEPHNRLWLMMLDMPVSLPPNATMSSNMQVTAREPVRTRMRYTVQSDPHYQLGLEMNDRERRLYLQLPKSGNPRARDLANNWHAQLQKPADIVQAALNMYRQQAFIYTLSPPRLGRDGIDEFLFSTRRGFCEHYAGSFVFLMRAAGIPARVVTGYQGGELNPVGNYLIVRQSDAHAWAEVWLEHRGWVRIDPTAAVSPSRVETGIADAVTDGDALPLLSRHDYPLLRKLYLNWDAVNNGWNQWVLGYNQQRQQDLLARIFGQAPDWQTLGIMLMGFSGLLLGIASFFLLRRRTVSRDPLQKLYQEFQNKLAQAGVKHQTHEGPRDYAVRAMQTLSSHAMQIEQISWLYIDARYGQHPSESQLRILRKLIRQFRPYKP